MAERQEVKASSKGKEPTNFKLRWREGKTAPREMSRQCDAVADGNTVYTMDGWSTKIYSFSDSSDSWSQLPDTVYKYCAITIINGLLTTVGGYSYPQSPLYSNELFSLTGEGSGRGWTKKFPPMPTKRMYSVAVCTGTMLIVAGGMGRDGHVLLTVEVMNTKHHQWSTAANLPEPLFYTSSVVCEEQIYMLGGIDERRSSTKTVYTCSVSALLQSCAWSSLEAGFERVSVVDKRSDRVWRGVANLPVTLSTCGSIHGRLLAIGGVMGSGEPTTAVHMYNSTTNSWEIISHITIGRYQCFAAVVPDNQLMVVGGNTRSYGGATDTVEIANICN